MGEVFRAAMQKERVRPEPWAESRELPGGWEALEGPGKPILRHGERVVLLEEEVGGQQGCCPSLRDEDGDTVEE